MLIDKNINFIERINIFKYIKKGIQKKKWNFMRQIIKSIVIKKKKWNLYWPENEFSHILSESKCDDFDNV